MVVRNRCPETGNEQYLVQGGNLRKAVRHRARRSGSRRVARVSADRRTDPVRDPEGTEGPFTFKAPWGETQTAKPGDVIAQDPNNPADTYRIAAASFRCTYSVTKTPQG